MATKIFVNLAIKDIKRTIEFWTKVGYQFNPQFTGDTAGAMVISEDIYAMLLTEPHFKEFTPKTLSDPKQSTEVITALSCDSKDEVKAVVERALAAGARRYAEPKDHGFMYQWGFEDPDGHIWEYFWMDPANVQK